MRSKRFGAGRTVAIVTSLVAGCAVELPDSEAWDTERAGKGDLGSREVIDGVQRIARPDLVERTEIDFTTDWRAIDFSLPLNIAYGDAPTPLTDEERAEIDPLDRDVARFDFDPYAANLDLVNAAWLAYFSSNAYSHFSALAEPLARAGFGRDGNAVEAAFWIQAGRDLYALRNAEASGEIDILEELTARYEMQRDGLSHLNGEGEELGDLVEAWYDDKIAPCLEEGSCDEYLKREGCRFGLFGIELGCRDRDVSLASAFEQWLVQPPETQNEEPPPYLQFFSGGTFDFDTDAGKMVFEAGSTQAFWARHGDKPLLVIAFRGTEMRRGQLWLDAAQSDADVLQTLLEIGAGALDVVGIDNGEPEWGGVHGGFQKAHAEVSSEIDHLLRRLFEDISRNGDEQVQIWVTGHSLGGALATLQAAHVLHLMDRMKEAGIEPAHMPFRLAGLYTFGSPRVGTAEFAARFDAKAEEHGVNLARFRRGDDVVTAVPFNVELLGLSLLDYEHVGGFTHLVGDRVRCDEEELPAVSVGFGDHPMLGYYDLLKGAQDLSVHGSCGPVVRAD